MLGESEIVVPAELAELHEKYSGEAGRLWIAGLPAMAVASMDRWELFGDGQVASGAVALIIPVARRDGSKAVLKLQPVDDETGGEPAALRAWAGRGAVQLLEHDPGSGAMLLERLDASRDLSTMEDDLAAAKIIAELLVHLNSVPAPAGMRQLSDVAAATLAGAPEAIRRVENPDERRLLINCADRLQELITDRIENRLLHWDLHYFNTLSTLDGAGAVEGDRSEAAQRRLRFRVVAGLVEPLGGSRPERRRVTGLAAPFRSHDRRPRTGPITRGWLDPRTSAPERCLGSCQIPRAPHPARSSHHRRGAPGRTRIAALRLEMRASGIARPSHGGGGSGGVLPLRATTTAADSSARCASSSEKIVGCSRASDRDLQSWRSVRLWPYSPPSS